MTATNTKTVEIVSFGFRHPAGVPQGADMLVDLRRSFRDPHVDPALRYLTAADARVRRAVYRTPGIPEQVSGIVLGALGHLRGPGEDSVLIAVGCAGGRHRAAATAHICALLLRRLGVTVELVHRDIGLDVLERTASGESVEAQAPAAARALHQLVQAIEGGADADAIVRMLVHEHQVPEALAAVLEAAAKFTAPDSVDNLFGPAAQIRAAVGRL